MTREVAYSDVIKRQLTSWLTLSGDIRQKLTFKENSSFFARIFTKRWIKIFFFSQQDEDHVVGDRAHTQMSHIETRASSLIIFSYLQIVISKESFLYTKTQTTLSKTKLWLARFSIDSHY